MTRSAAPVPAQATAGNMLPIATVRSYDDLRRAVADHCDRVGMSRMELDGEAGLTDGHSAKLLSARARKKLGMVTLGRVIAAAGLVLIVAIDPDAPYRDLIGSKLGSRARRYDRTKHWRNVKGPTWSRRLNAMRNLKLSAARRSEIARHAAQVRHQRRAAPVEPTAD